MMDDGGGVARKSQRYAEKKETIISYFIINAYFCPHKSPTNPIMKKNVFKLFAVATGCTLLTLSCAKQTETGTQELLTVGNPYLPLWEHIPDGEPYVFEDPDQPGKMRVYIYGSHDSRITDYCGRELVVWSASVDSLYKWRYDGEILKVDKNAKGEPFDSVGTADVLFAPDVTLVTDANGKKTYYLYPNDQVGGRNGLIAKSDRPDGPFEVCNWNNDNPYVTDGVLRFDPAVFVDDDGRVYGYWGFETSNGAELDPTTMATVKPGTKIVENMISGCKQPGEFRFFEASSIRKIKDKYVFIYSRFTKDGEFGLPTTNYTLAYAYSDHPLGPWTYGGTIIDGRAREINEQGDTIASANPSGNTHGSICEINGQWYVFYHRQSGLDEFARQAMVAPIEVKVEEGPGGKVEITEGEYTSEGFALDGLNPLERHSAGIACWYTGPKPAVHEWPNNTFYGSYVKSSYGTDDKFAAPYELRNNTNQVVNNTDGSIVGYKYFNFTETKEKNDLKLLLRLIPEGIDGKIEVMIDRPWASQGGKSLGAIELKADMPKTSTEVSIPLPDLAEMTGKRAIFFLFTSETKEKSICTLEDFVFAY